MENPSGISPVEYNVLILPDEIEERIGSILLPEQVKEKDRHAQQRGTLIEVSPGAFRNEAYHYFPEEQKPKPGQSVWFGRYAGGVVEGKDGKKYRLIKDVDIGAVVS